MNRIIDRIQDIIEDNVKSSRGIIQVYKGDPIAIPSVNMPAIAINPEQTTLQTLSTCEDVKIQQISIVVIIDARKYFNSSDIETGLFEIAKIMEEEDSSGDTKNDTIVGAVRKYLYNDSDYVYKTSDEVINYGFREREFPTIEASFTFNAYRKPHVRDN